MVGEESIQLGHQLALPILFEDDVLIGLHDGETLIELRPTILVAHPLFELGELARRNVDHFILAHVAMDVGVLAFVVDGSGSSCCSSLMISSLNRDHIEVLLIAIFTNIADLSLGCYGCLRSSGHSIILVTGSQVPLVLVKLVLEEGRVSSHLHKLLGRLNVHIHCGHLGCSLVSSRLVLLLLTFLLLYALEFIEHILVMQESVGELVQEVLMRKETLNAALEDRHFE